MITSLLAEIADFSSETLYYVWYVSCIVLMVGILLSAVIAIILVLMQQSKGDGIDALNGSSDTFYGQNKGQSIESKLKKWTVISIVCMAVLSIVFYVLQIIA